MGRQKKEFANNDGTISVQDANGNWLGKMPANPTPPHVAAIPAVSAPTGSLPDVSSQGEERPFDTVCGQCGTRMNVGMTALREPSRSLRTRPHMTPEGTRCFNVRSGTCRELAPEHTVDEALERQNREKFPGPMPSDEYYETLQQLGYGTPGCPKKQPIRHPEVYTVQYFADVGEPGTLEVALFGERGEWFTGVVEELEPYARGEYGGTRIYRGVPVGVLSDFKTRYLHGPRW